MAVLHLVWSRGERLSLGSARRPDVTGLLAPFVVASAALLGACERAPEMPPDQLLQEELGLTSDDRVHRVTLSGGVAEHAEPGLVRVVPGAYVEFVTSDWLIHEILFEADSLSEEQRAFLVRTDQVASPPLLERGSRFVLSFVGAPPGRYAYRMEGNGGPGRGAIEVVEQAAR